MKKFKNILKSLLICIAVAALCMLWLTISDTASADGSDPYAPYFYQYYRTGTVVCSQLTVRNSPSTNGKEYGKMKNGQTCVILGEYDEWFMIDLSSIGVSSGGYGFAKSALIKEDPAWIVLTKYTYMYTDPWNYYGAKRNGEQTGRVCLIISENQDFYCVQCKENSPGSSFIRKYDVGQYSQYGQNLQVVAENDVPMYEAPFGGGTKDVLARFTIVNADAYSDVYCHVTVNTGTEKQYDGWVETRYLQRIIN